MPMNTKNYRRFDFVLGAYTEAGSWIELAQIRDSWPAGRRKVLEMIEYLARHSGEKQLSCFVIPDEEEDPHKGMLSFDQAVAYFPRGEDAIKRLVSQGKLTAVMLDEETKVNLKDGDDDYVAVHVSKAAYFGADFIVALAKREVVLERFRERLRLSTFFLDNDVKHINDILDEVL